MPTWRCWSLHVRPPDRLLSTLLLQAVQPMDKRIHFALVCGAKSCPPIRVYTAEDLDEGLDAAASAFCEGARAAHLLCRCPHGSRCVLAADLQHWEGVLTSAKTASDSAARCRMPLPHEELHTAADDCLAPAVPRGACFLCRGRNSGSRGAVCGAVLHLQVVR